MAKHKVEITGINTSFLKSLPPKESAELLIAYHNGDKKAKEDLILGNMKLVLSITNKFSKRIDNLDDLFQIGIVGLIKAIDNFDVNQNVKFSTYAVPMILGEIKRYLRDNSLLRISRQIKDRGYKAIKAKEKFIEENHKEPTNEELAKILNLSTYEVAECFEAMNQALSLNEPLYNDFNESIDLMDVIPVEMNNVERFNNLLSLKNGIDSLSMFEKEIIYRRYYEGETQLELAEDYGISQAQVSRLEKNALKQLRKYF